MAPNRSTVDRAAGPAARTLNLSSYATNGAIGVTRREAEASGSDCGVEKCLGIGVLHCSGGVGATY